MSRKKRHHGSPENEILETERRILEVEERELHVLEDIDRDLHKKPNVTGATIHQIGNPMSLLPIAAGNSPQFQATVVPAGAPTVAAQTVWSSSDSVNAPVTVNSADQTGLTATVAIPATATPNTPFDLTYTYTNADGTTAVATASFVIAAGGNVVNITSATIAQIV
jgi:hypothetical protein